MWCGYVQRGEWTLLILVKPRWVTGKCCPTRSPFLVLPPVGQSPGRTSCRTQNAAGDAGNIRVLLLPGHTAAIHHQLSL